MPYNKVMAVLLGAAGLVIALPGCSAGDSQRHLRTAVDAERKGLTACYERTLEQDASAQGNMKLWVYVDEQSHEVEKVEVESSDLRDPQLETCVQDTIGGVMLPAASPQRIKVDYTLRFVHTGSGGEVPASDPGTGDDLPEDDGEGVSEASGGVQFTLGGE